ncbi:3df50d49-923d-4f53-bc19-79063e68e46e [Thermothielavioides terrestris]|uniref:3df50d49-923d-4f53-bc19-79063e68e46e n=1 Tax=Thermothielavioides terrestris TaxID=2587410 RepID=A0A446B9N2_9PEZI|nr:3df50d49-923d-4f53-bc19-79063e68e46e [Thermothielavioides terrestris]
MSSGPGPEQSTRKAGGPSNGDAENSASGAAGAAASTYEPGIADVLVTKAMLRKALRLPPEIIGTIIDLAEYWPHTTTAIGPTSDGASVEPATVIVRHTEGNNNRFLLRCPPLGLHRWERASSDGDVPPAEQMEPRARPPGEEFSTDDFQELVAAPVSLLAHPCRRLVFTIRSHDQGWGGAPGDRGTYHGSWTWFEPDDLCTVIPEVVRDALADRYVFNQPLLPCESLKIQCNVTATRTTRVHRVVWSYTDDIDPDLDVEAAEEQLAQKGRGKATGNGRFVRELKLGDVVTVWAKTRFPHWANHVESVKVDVYYAV